MRFKNNLTYKMNQLECLNPLQYFPVNPLCDLGSPLFPFYSIKVFVNYYF